MPEFGRRPGKIRFIIAYETPLGVRFATFWRHAARLAQAPYNKAYIIDLLKGTAKQVDDVTEFLSWWKQNYFSCENSSDEC